MFRRAVSFAFSGAAALAVAVLPATASATPIQFPGSPGGAGIAVPQTPASQANAVRAAKDYLETMPFSRTGLIRQLQFEGYSAGDSTYAVDSISVDWNAQAARSAKSYLEMMAFSRSGMIQQLQFEGFTASQAAYGASAVGL